MEILILILNSLVQGFAVGHLGAAVGGRLRHAGARRSGSSAVFHLLRNLGSSFFISLSIAERASLFPCRLPKSCGQPRPTTAGCRR
jgi:hypothetical protein